MDRIVLGRSLRMGEQPTTGLGELRDVDVEDVHLQAVLSLG